MRLGDLDALKEAIKTYDTFACLPDGKLYPVRDLKHPEMFITYIHVEDVIKAIDNAPIVEYTFEEAFQKTVCDNKLYCPSRQKGKWKETGYETGALGITYRQTQCSNCGWEHSLPMWLNFCPNCGAKMQKGSSE